MLQGSIEKLTETNANRYAGTAGEDAARHAAYPKISEGLVDFSRMRKQQMEPVPMRHLIDEAWRLVAIDKKAAARNSPIT